MKGSPGLVCALLVVCLSASHACAQANPLKELGIEPTKEGVGLYLRELVDGKHAPLKDKEADALIAELGHNQFKVRETATKRLAALHFPPLDKLTKATQSTDPEIARRATLLLEQIATKPDIAALVCRLIQKDKLAIPLDQLLKAIAVLESPAAEEAAQDAFATIAQATDKDAIEKALADANPRVKAAAVRVLGLLHKDPAAQWQKHLKDRDARLRLAAARGLVDSATTFDFKDYAKVLDADAMVLVLRAADKRFRHLHATKNLDPKVLTDYDVLVAQYVAALKNAKVADQAVKQPSGDHKWVNQKLDTSKHPEVLAYRIRWFAGHWSCWYVPGFNDIELNSDRDARYWGCFADHEHEVVTTAKKEMYREIMDLTNKK